MGRMSVKMKKPVSGIAMGLITDTDGAKYAVLSDILGDEDHLGDMDFKEPALSISSIDTVAPLAS